MPAGQVVRGTVRVPPSKSLTHRHLLLGLLAGDSFSVRHPLQAEDTELTLEVLRTLGYQIRFEADGSRVRLDPPASPPEAARFDCGNAGTLCRFLVGVLATRPGRWIVDGAPRLRERPIGPLVEALRALGARFTWMGESGYPPLEIHGEGLRGGSVMLEAGESSQYVSALLLAALRAEAPVTIEVESLVSEPYVDLTVAAIGAWGGAVARRDTVFRVEPAALELDEAVVEGDVSAACYHAAAAALTGGTVTVQGVASDTVQGDRGFFELLERMGTAVEWTGSELRVQGEGAMSAVDADLSSMPDQVPTLAALAPFATGVTRIRGASHLRLKESDRLAAMTVELRRLGALVEETEDGLEIEGSWAHRAPPSDDVVVDTHDDHRIAMSLAVVALRRPGIEIARPGVVAKSYPDFWQHLDSLLVESNPGLHHPAFSRGDSIPLADATLTDRRRVGVLLEGAAVLSHLERAGLRLAAGWEGAAIDGEGRLVGLSYRSGTDPMPPSVRLLELTRRLFGSDAVAGRGHARRVARELVERWRSAGELAGRSAVREVDEMLRRLTLLWEDDLALARRSLEARLDGVPIVAAPPRIAERLLCCDEVLGDLLASQTAREWWCEEPEGDPLALLEERRWRRAAAIWRRRAPRDRRERLAHAEALHQLGRYQTALEVLEALGSPAAEVLMASCEYFLGRLDAAWRRLQTLHEVELGPAEELHAAELAVRIAANRGRVADGEVWVKRVRQAVPASLAWRAELVAAQAAWDRGDGAAMHQALKSAAAGADDPRDGWRWHHVRAMAAMLADDHETVVREIGRALRGYRRDLGAGQAAALWTDLAVGRCRLGDLAGAERAARHVARLHERSEGPRRATLALRNLAEIRLRRGRLAGVAAMIERSLARNRLDGNVRAAAHDGALWARWELVQGRAGAAVETCRDARDRLTDAGDGWRLPELDLLECRALGWLERGEEAAEVLDRLSPTSLTELEPEERPALLALAGARDRALAAAEGASAALWRAALDARPVPSGAWDELAALEPYRIARLVWDLELVAPGLAPSKRRRRAASTLRRVGATELADQLERRFQSAWEGVTRFIRSPEEDGAVERLFESVGLGDARLSYCREGETRQLIGAAGGGVELSAPYGGGYLLLSAPAVDAATRAAFELVRALVPPEASNEPTRPLAPGIVGRSACLTEALEPLPRFARASMPVLILGESGTGKELVAREIHRLSARADQTLLPLNCAAFSESLLLSELFGHVRGAFTGAERDRAGIFETARGGTVFLDEIGDLPPSAQGMLLRVLQEGEIRRVGESVPRPVDVRLVAATHRDLERLVAEGGFRHDLYYRLRVATLELPPLRERGRDVVLLAQHFLRRAGRGEELRLSRAAEERLLRHRWPGNVRELQNVIEVAAALADRTVEIEHLQLPSETDEPPSHYHLRVERFRRQLVEEALAASGGNQAAAARRLGLTRQALSYLVRSFEITP